ncbi:hypothetical protein ABZ172_11995 [Streptomyces sp. NPDC006296]|uniref:hypothetical protein n=1 Tax=Streptomyces sp. NPDC006296 TaxID=3156746 RepID=UPI0033BB4C7F
MPKHLYSWREWMDGEVHILKRGEHFEKDPEAFAKSVRRYASRHGMAATAIRGTDTVTVQFFDADETEREGES